MAYLRCTTCGSKALVAASQCPKCSHPFNLLDARGERAKLKRCRSCGIMHRADAQCHWCGEVKSGLPTVSGPALRSAAAFALMLSAAGGVWRFAPALREAADSLRATVAAESARMSADAPDRKAASGTAMPADTNDVSASGAPVADSTAVVANAPPGASAPAGETAIRWVPAVARTWVNVRSDASRGGVVVGVIKPDSRAMLGTDRAGWRQVRSSDVSGWVDPRLFVADSMRTSGE